MKSMRLLSFAWILTLLAAAGIYTYAEITFVDQNLDKGKGDDEEEVKEITVKAVNELMEPYSDKLDPKKKKLLPKIGSSGQTSYDTYAAPDRSRGPQPRVAILVTSLGLRERDTNFSIEQLPPEVSLAFSPYAPTDLLKWGEKARAGGHEVWIEVPMEPRDTERTDPGPLALLTKASKKQNMTRLRSILSSMQGYVGVVNERGDLFTVQKQVMQPFLIEVKNRGLIYVDKKSTSFTQGPVIAKALSMKYAMQDIRIDLDLNPEEIANQLKNLEDNAIRNGFALGVASSKLITLKEIATWSRALSRRGVRMVPVSSLALKYRPMSE